MGGGEGGGGGGGGGGGRRGSDEKKDGRVFGLFSSWEVKLHVDQQAKDLGRLIPGQALFMRALFLDLQSNLRFTLCQQINMLSFDMDDDEEEDSRSSKEEQDEVKQEPKVKKKKRFGKSLSCWVHLVLQYLVIQLPSNDVGNVLCLKIAF